MSPAAGDTDSTLSAAIEEAQRRQEMDLRWASHIREHEFLAESLNRRLASVEKLREVGDEEVDRRFAEVKANTDTALSAANLALRTALASIDQRFAEVNAATEKRFVEAQLALKAALADHHREHEVHDNAHKREHEQTETALGKAETATEKRFAGVNEFREQLRDQAQRLASTERVDAISKGLSERLDALQKDVDRRFEEARIQREKAFEATAGTADSRYAVFTTQLTDLQKANVAREGQSKGQTGTLAAIIAAVGFSATAIGLVVLIAGLLTK